MLYEIWARFFRVGRCGFTATPVSDLLNVSPCLDGVSHRDDYTAGTSRC
jgi:hypothetical protein